MGQKVNVFLSSQFLSFKKKAWLMDLYPLFNNCVCISFDCAFISDSILRYGERNVKT